ncbi:hypothetical protein BU17DRAFT_64878 [Hysterangium stoloniferum]|nr:hypothetical protein BU17DRAFT_64878 [Hysterangium stoloniferum]
MGEETGQLLNTVKYFNISALNVEMVFTLNIPGNVSCNAASRFEIWFADRPIKHETPILTTYVRGIPFLVLTVDILLVIRLFAVYCRDTRMGTFLGLIYIDYSHRPSFVIEVIRRTKRGQPFARSDLKVFACTASGSAFEYCLFGRYWIFYDVLTFQVLNIGNVILQTIAGPLQGGAGLAWLVCLTSITVGTQYQRSPRDEIHYIKLTQIDDHRFRIHFQRGEDRLAFER